MTKFVTRKEATKILGIHYHTLYSLVEKGEIETLKLINKQMYNVEKYLLKKGIKNQSNKKINICYCRVSSNKQKEDLKRQIEYMKEKYPTYKIVSDIGSSLNFKRKGLTEIINEGIKGNIGEVVIAYKDRLARIGFELIEMIIETYSEGKIKIINKTKEETPTEEMTKDVMSIMNIYVAKINGLRKYKKEIKECIEKDGKCENIKN